MIFSNLSTCYSGVWMTNQASDEQASIEKKKCKQKTISSKLQCFVYNFKRVTMFCFQLALPIKHGKRSRGFVLLTFLS